jgi:glycosyltransferase involved in cell wall biosynthesis
LENFFCAHPEYKIVHVHQDCLSSVILKVAKKCGVPVRIAHSHSGSQDKNLKYLIKLFYKQFIPAHATQLFACGKEAGEWMFGGAPFRVLNNAIDTTCYSYNTERHNSMRRELQIPDDAFVVGHVGRFNTVKNHTFLLDVFAKANAQNENLVLLLVGDGDLRAEMEQKAATLGISDRVIFTGVRSDVPDLMQAMDCFVFPSLYEGLGIVAVEAQAAGLPCLVSDGVPVECVKTDLVKHIPLSASTTQWAEEILKTQRISRRNTKDQIVQAGYDIEANAQWLQNYYLEQWEEA